MSELVGNNNNEYDYENPDKKLCKCVVCRWHLDRHKHQYGIEEGVEKGPIVIPMNTSVKRFGDLEDPGRTGDDANKLQVAKSAKLLDGSHILVTSS